MSKQRKSASKTPAKGKADKLITNAEAPAAECSRPMPPHGKGRTGVAQSVFSAIAEQLRAIPGRTGRIIDAENTAGRLLAEALKHGAFARIKHTHLRTWIDGAIEKGLYHVAFGSAVNWFREYEPHWPAVAAWQNVGSSSCFKNGCPLLADVLEGEADVPEGERVLTPPVPGRLEAVAKAEELQRRQETARLSEQHLRRLGVVYGRRGVNLGGQPPAAEAKAAAAEAQAGKPKLDDEARLRVRVGGTWYDISDEAMRMLRILFKAEGAWVQGSTISRENRPDKTRKRMHAAVSAIIESHKRHGYRIPSLLPK